MTVKTQSGDPPRRHRTITCRAFHEHKIDDFLVEVTEQMVLRSFVLYGCCALEVYVGCLTSYQIAPSHVLVCI